MARSSNRLTALTVSRAKKPGLIADGHGLYLRIRPGGAKSWVFRYRREGKLHDVGLGATHTVSLADARGKALDLRRQRLDGVDPLAAKREAAAKVRAVDAKAMTFRAAAQAYVASHRSGWRNQRHGKQWITSLTTYVYPVLGELPVGIVDVALVMKVLEPIWRTRTETASRIRGRIEMVLDWAAVRGYRTGDNPARWRGHIENLLPAKTKVARVEHHAALPYAKLPAFFAELRQLESVAARALEFVILTAARTGEVRGATWQEIDLYARLWVIPPERMKARREHRVPLNDPAMAIVTALYEVRESDFVFTGKLAQRPLSDSALLRVLRRMGRADITTHGFRSAFSDWCAEQTAFPSEVREMALAHAVGDRVEAAYRRGDLFEKRRQLMDEWSRYCARLVVTIVDTCRLL